MPEAAYTIYKFIDILKHGISRVSGTLDLYDSEYECKAYWVGDIIRLDIKGVERIAACHIQQEEQPLSK